MSLQPLHRDLPPREDFVTLAVVPIDGVTGAIVRSGVSARVKDLPVRPLANASGMLVFLNLPPPEELPGAPDHYEVEVDATGAGFFGPETFPYKPPAPTDLRPERERKRRLEVLLAPRPDFRFPAGATLVRGVVVRGSAPVGGALIACRPPGTAADFEARSAGNGAFALAVRLPPPPDFDTGTPVEVKLRLSEGGDVRVLTGKLTRGRSHSFEEPIDLVGLGEPGFFTI